MPLVRSTRLCAALLVLAAASCRQHQPKSMPAPPPENRPQPVARSQGPQASSRIPAGTLAGLVVDALTGQPLSRAQVVVMYEGSALTDSSGHFRVGISARVATVQVRHEGYFETNFASHYRPGSGQVAVVALTRDDARCRMGAGNGFPGVVVVVRDAMSMLAPTSLVSVIVRHGEQRDSLDLAPESSRPLVFRTAAGRTGAFAVTVRARGYRPWSAFGSTQPVPDCPWQLAPATFHAWLLPE